MPRALVTGGAGFIGSALVRALAAAGFDARVLDDLSAGSPANLEGTGAELVTGDVRDLDLVVGAARGCDVVFHLAAGAGVVESMNDPLTNFDQNARGTLTALEAARRAEVPRLVFSSSNAPLGENAYPASEDKPVAPSFLLACVLWSDVRDSWSRRLAQKMHPFPSLQEEPLALGGFEQIPFVWLQVPAVWHWSSAVHTTGFVPTQTPFWQTSVWVQALPSLHGRVLLTWTHPRVGSQVSSVHGFPSSQFRGPPPTQTAPWHAPPTVQASEPPPQAVPAAQTS